MKLISTGSILILLFIPFFLLGKQANKPERFRLIHSDKMFLSRQEDEQILELLGKVHFFYGETEFKSDRAIVFDTQKIARLYGNVKVNTDTLTMVADTVAYYRTPELLNLGGKVFITESKPDGSFRTFNSDFASYDQKEDKLTVWKNVRSYDKEENAHLECGYAFWDRKAGYAYLLEEPKLRAGKEDTLRISSDKMEFFDRERKLIATFNVETKSKDYKLNSDFLIYFLREDKAVFTGKPVFKSSYATASANEFYLYLKERKLQRAELVDSCQVYFAEEENATQSNWVHASRIELEFEDDNISSFVAEEGVSYYYLQEKKEKRDFFENSATGQYLEAKFNKNNKLELMKMKKSIQGKYKFQNNS